MEVISCSFSRDAAGAQEGKIAVMVQVCASTFIENNVTAGPQPTQLDSLSSAGGSEEQGSPGGSAMSGESHGE